MTNIFHKELTKEQISQPQFVIEFLIAQLHTIEHLQDRETIAKIEKIYCKKNRKRY